MLIRAHFRSILQLIFISQVFYLPLALFIPPSHFIAHKQFNLIYQLCLHTTVIGSLGPLEWILNTSKHHRVHHGNKLVSSPIIITVINAFLYPQAAIFTVWIKITGACS